MERTPEAGSRPPSSQWPDRDVPSLGRVSLLSAAGAFLDGYDLLIINAALLAIVPTFHLGNGQTGLLTSLPFLGMVVGALGAGRLCDRFGRRRIYMIDVVAFLVVTLLLAGAQDYWQLLVLRLILGVAIGMDMPTGTSMLAEFAPAGKLGRLTALMQTIWVFGGLCAAVMGYVLYVVLGTSSWRWMFVSSAVPAVFIAVLRHSLPESPRWKATHDTARRLARRGREGLRSVVAEPRYRRPVLFFTAYWFVESFLGGPPFVYTALIFNKVIHLSAGDALLLSASLAVIYVVADLVAQFFVLDRTGRRPLGTWICGAAAISAAATGMLETSSIALVIAFGVFAVATQVAPVPFWPWSVEQLPTRIRATGQSIGSAGGKLGQFIGLNLFTAGSIAVIGWKPYFVGVGMCFALLAVYVRVRGHETRLADLDALDATPSHGVT